MSTLAVRAENLSKRYQLGATVQRRLTETLWNGLVWPARRFSGSGIPDKRRFIWALKDVSLEVAEGEVVGIIGRNGAGKSTFLKILSRITEPTAGRAFVTGTVGSLLEVGVGFHPDLTGAENVNLYGTILGMSRASVKQKFDEIVEFAEIAEFIDTPVKRYSSGMYTRLAFAVAAHLDADIMIVDEVLAVGDVAFQRKCLAKMEEASTDGRTVLFVSHNLPAISSLCQRAYLLERGRVTHTGAAADVVDYFWTTLRTAEKTPLNERDDREGNGSVQVVGLSIEDADSTGAITPTSRLRLTLDYESVAAVHEARFLVAIKDAAHSSIFRLDSEAEGGLPAVLPAEGSVTCITEPIHITPGRCTVSVAILHGGSMADALDYAASFDVEPAGFHGWRDVPGRSSALTLRRHAWTATRG